jgi:hypothetical protein
MNAQVTNEIRGGVMKKYWLGYLLAFVVSVTVLAAAQNIAYEAGKIVKVERQSDTAGGGGTDAASTSATATYKISVQVNDRVYLVRYQAQGDQDLSWIQGKDVQVRVSGKKMYVKRASGADAKAGIISKSKASTP